MQSIHFKKFCNIYININWKCTKLKTNLKQSRGNGSCQRTYFFSFVKVNELGTSLAYPNWSKALTYIFWRNWIWRNQFQLSHTLAQSSRYGPWVHKLLLPYFDVLGKLTCMLLGFWVKQLVLWNRLSINIRFIFWRVFWLMYFGEI